MFLLLSLNSPDGYHSLIVGIQNTLLLTCIARKLMSLLQFIVYIKWLNFKYDHSCFGMFSS